jgi:hypothetical protein
LRRVKADIPGPELLAKALRGILLQSTENEEGRMGEESPNFKTTPSGAVFPSHAPKNAAAARHGYLRALVVPLVLVVSLAAVALAGCYYGNRPLTYPSPAPTQGERIVYPPVDPRGAGLSDFDQLCGERWTPAASGPTRSAVAFDSDGLQLCFMSPMVAGHRGEFSCIATAFDHVASRAGLIFHVFMLGSNLDLSNASATLEVGGGASSVAAEVENSPIGGSADMPGAVLVNPQAAPRWRMYSLPRKKLTFRFPQPCDPFAHYQLTLGGIARDGAVVPIPPVRFEPFKEWRPMLVD